MAATAPGKDDDPFAGFEYLYEPKTGARPALEPARRQLPGVKADPGSAAGATRAQAPGQDGSHAGSAPTPAPEHSAPDTGIASQDSSRAGLRWAAAVAALAVLAGGLVGWAVLGPGAGEDRQASPAARQQAPTAPGQDPSAAPAQDPSGAPAQDPTGTPAQDPTAAPTPAGGSGPSASPQLPSAAPAPITPSVATAEQLERSGGAILATNHKGFTGAGFVTGLDRIGAAVGWRVQVPVGGYYRLTVRYSNARGTDLRTIERNLGVSANGRSFGQIRMPVIGSWDSWGTTWRIVKLVKGANRIVLSCGPEDSCRVNLDTFRLSLFSLTS